MKNFVLIFVQITTIGLKLKKKYKSGLVPQRKT